MNNKKIKNQGIEQDGKNHEDSVLGHARRASVESHSS